MKTLNIIFSLLIMPAIALAASASSVHGGHNIAQRPDGKEASGRGVGNGIGEYVKDIFIIMATELNEVQQVNNGSDKQDLFSDTQGGFQGVFLDIDADAIMELVDSRKIHVVNEDSLLVSQGVAYVVSNGNLYLNAQYWDEVLKKEGQEAKVIQVLLLATGHEDESGILASYYAKKIKTRGVDSRSPMELY